MQTNYRTKSIRSKEISQPFQQATTFGLSTIFTIDVNTIKSSGNILIFFPYTTFNFALVNIMISIHVTFVATITPCIVLEYLRCRLLYVLYAHELRHFYVTRGSRSGSSNEINWTFSNCLAKTKLPVTMTCRTQDEHTQGSGIA